MPTNYNEPYDEREKHYLITKYLDKNLYQYKKYLLATTLFRIAIILCLWGSIIFLARPNISFLSVSILFFVLYVLFEFQAIFSKVRTAQRNISTLDKSGDLNYKP